MPAATNAQVQQYVNSRVRPRCEQIRALYLAIKDDKAAIDDIYANLTNNPNWADSHDQNPPHLMTPNDVLAWNAFISGFIDFVEANANYAVVLDGCVRPAVLPNTL